MHEETRRELNGRQRMVIIGADVLMVAWLFLAMRLASHAPEEFTVVFAKTFFGLLVPTLAAAFIAVRRLRSDEAESAAREVARS